MTTKELMVMGVANWPDCGGWQRVFGVAVFFSSTTRRGFLAVLWLLGAWTVGLGQTGTVTIAGVVTDPSGAVVPNALIRASDQRDRDYKAITNGEGRYMMRNLRQGTYVLTVEAAGFAALRRDRVEVEEGRSQILNLSLSIAVQQEQVNVAEDDKRLGTNPDANAGALVFEGNDLDALPDDPAALLAQLQGMAGASPGADGPSLFIDGFSGGKLPARSAIREVRINQNPYSAQFDRPGYGRIEVFTKPGGNQLHGGGMVLGNDSSFNSSNPFVQNEPPYHSTLYYGDLEGSVRKKFSYFLNVEHGDFATNAIVNAEVLDANLQQQAFSEAIATPQRSDGAGLRVDFQPASNQTATLRYQFYRSTGINNGVGEFALPAQAYRTESTEQSIQFGDSQNFGSSLVNETRFQYIRDRNNQVAASDDPAVIVEGAFTDGGNSAGNGSDNQDRYEVQDSLFWTRGNHFFKFGGRFRLLRDANVARSGFNGTYVFPSLNAYQTTLEGLQNQLSEAEIRALGGEPIQFTRSAGRSAIVVTVGDLGLYAEDDWKLRPNLTWSYGLRYETQNGIHDSHDFAPRFGLAWGVDARGKGSPATVIRLGYGWFYTRFASSYLLQQNRQDGVEQQQFIVAAPTFYPEVPPASELGAKVGTTIYRENPGVRAPYVMQAGISVERQLGKSGTLSVSYLDSRGLHQLLTRNINAPLPGTYDLSDPASGSRPFDGSANIYQYTSEGIFKQDQLILNVRSRATSRVNLYGYYVWNSVQGDVSGEAGFPSNSYNLAADYGRTAYDVHHRAFLGGSINMPFGVQVNPWLMISSGAPFNIVLGEDLNGDAQFNDRPTYATDLNRSSVAHTRWGDFDTNPLSGQETIPINLGTGTAQVMMNLRVAKSIGFGPETGSSVGAGVQGNAANRKGRVTRRYTVNFAVSAQNALNRVNLAAPVGTIGSPLFGKSNALAGSASANRIVNLQMGLRF